MQEARQDDWSGFVWVASDCQTGLHGGQNQYRGFRMFPSNQAFFHPWDPMHAHHEGRARLICLGWVLHLSWRPLALASSTPALCGSYPGTAGLHPSGPVQVGIRLNVPSGREGSKRVQASRTKLGGSACRATTLEEAKTPFGGAIGIRLSRNRRLVLGMSFVTPLLWICGGGCTPPSIHQIICRDP